MQKKYIVISAPTVETRQLRSLLVASSTSSISPVFSPSSSPFLLPEMGNSNSGVGVNSGVDVFYLELEWSWS